MKSTKILILFAHPMFERSVVHQALVQHIPTSVHITFHDLYEEYPDFDVDIYREQALLMEHDIIIWQHPMYWYSCPPLLKQWIDLVLEYNWAYGKKGNFLKDKLIFQVITTGGKQENYCATGRDRFTIPDLLEPFNQTAKVCQMNYLPPFVIHGTHDISEEEIDFHCKQYLKLLNYLIVTDIFIDDISPYHYLNDWFNSKTLING